MSSVTVAKVDNKTVTIDIGLFIYTLYTYSGFFGNIRQFRGTVSAFIESYSWTEPLFPHDDLISQAPYDSQTELG